VSSVQHVQIETLCYASSITLWHLGDNRSVTGETDHAYHVRRRGRTQLRLDGPAQTKVMGPFLTRDSELVDVHVVLPPQRMQVVVRRLAHKDEPAHGAHPRRLASDDLLDGRRVALERHEIVGVVYGARAGLEGTSLHVGCDLRIGS